MRTLLQWSLAFNLLAIATLRPARANETYVPPTKDPDEELRPRKKEFSEETKPSVEPETPQSMEKKLTLSLALLKWIVPAGELRVELPPHPKFGVSIFAALGGISSHSSVDNSNTGRKLYWSMGLEGRYYATGTFSTGGITLGLLATFSRASFGANEAGNSIIATPGFQLGPTLGYKLVIPFGLTIDTNFGIGFLPYKQNAPNDDRIAAIVGDVYLGWTF